MGNVYMEAEQIRYKGQYRNVQEALDNGGGGGGTTVVANPEGAATADLAKLQVGTTIYGIPAEAGDISYDNTTSGMTADDVQDAIDELKASIPGVATTSAPGIVQPDGTSIAIVDGVISAVGGSGGGEAYSTTETAIGTWKGQTLYRKVIEFGALPNISTKSVSSGLANVTIRKIYGIGYLSTGATAPIPFIGGAINSMITLSCDASLNIGITTGEDRSSWNADIILEYTKNS